MAEKAISGLPAELDEENRIRIIAKKKTGIKKEKIIRHLAGRGFPFETIIDVLNGVDS